MNRIPLTIGIPTYRRPEKLTDLLSSLPSRIAEAAELVDVAVLVVDNDPKGSAREVVAAYGADLPIRYLIETTPGIAAVRNRILVESAASRLIAFIDDDERPREEWLAALVRVWQPTQPAAVMGRVISVFEADADEWVLATGVFRRRPRVTGIGIDVAAAGNLLIDVRAVDSYGIRFDESLGLSGGEDTLFSKQLRRAGGRILWCNESETEDFVPRDRVSREWAMRRAFNGGNSAIQVALCLDRSPADQLRIRTGGLVGGMARVVGGIAMHLAGRWGHDLHRNARGMRTAHRGWGMVRAALGHRHEEYDRSLQHG